MDKPIRIQRRRTKGWRLPPNTVCVDRGTAFGNPFTVADAKEAGYRGEQLQAFVVDCFDDWLRGDRSAWMGEESDAAAELILSRLPELRGRNLACWCPPDSPCHADVLLRLANAPGRDGKEGA